VSAAESTEASAQLDGWLSLTEWERSQEHPSFAASLFFRLLKLGRDEEAWRVHNEAEALLASPPLSPEETAAAAAAAAPQAVLLGPDGLPLATAPVDAPVADREAGVWDLARTRAWLEAFEHFGWPGHIAEAERAWLRLLHAGAQSQRRVRRKKKTRRSGASAGQASQLSFALSSSKGEATGGAGVGGDGVGILRPDIDLYVQMIRLYMLHGGPAQLAKIDAFWQDACNSGPASLLPAKTQGDSSSSSNSDGVARAPFTSVHYTELISTARACGLTEQVSLWLERARVAGTFAQLPSQIRFADLLDRKQELLSELRSVTLRATARFPDAGHTSASSPGRLLPKEVRFDPAFVQLRNEARAAIDELTKLLVHASNAGASAAAASQQKLRGSDFEQALDALDVFDLHAQYALGLFGVLQRQEVRLYEQAKLVAGASSSSPLASSASDSYATGVLPYEHRFPLRVIERLLLSIARGTRTVHARNSSTPSSSFPSAPSFDPSPSSSVMLDVSRALYSPAMAARVQLPRVHALLRLLSDCERENGPGCFSDADRRALLARLETVLLVDADDGRSRPMAVPVDDEALAAMSFVLVRELNAASVSASAATAVASSSETAASSSSSSPSSVRTVSADRAKLLARAQRMLQFSKKKAANVAATGLRLQAAQPHLLELEKALTQAQL
jgi:hypothetical protein